MPCPSPKIPSFFRLTQIDVTQSTNEDVKRAAEAGEPEGLVVRALRQTSGKGRQGRAWESPEGNLYVSALLRPRCSPQEAGLYSFVAALAVHDAVRAFLPDAAIALKWPNDVLAGGKKISGILLEAAPVDKGVVEWLVVGIGVNVLHSPDGGLYPATSLTAENGCRTVNAVVDELLTHFDRWRQTYLVNGFIPVRAAWLERAKKGQITARLPHETVQGEFVDLDNTGRLILRLQDGTEKAIAAGDVFFVDRGSAFGGQEDFPGADSRPSNP